MKPRALTSTLAALALCLAAAGPAAAKPTTYKGKTAGGHTITFKREGKRVWFISTMAPTTCLPINRVGSKPIGGAEMFTPPGPQITGRKTTFEETQKPVLHYSPVRKHYEVTLDRPGRGGRLTGRLHLTFGFIVPTYPMPTMLIYSCVGKTSFSARPR